jgi:D-aminoacyl-tRNA deacylase
MILGTEFLIFLISLKTTINDLTNPFAIMITIIQRVSSASVTVHKEVIGKIQQGILALVAIEKDDNDKDAQRLLERILNYRIFADNNERMNLSLADIQGGLLLVPQFTLAADTNSGNRPSFSQAAPPEQGRQQFEYLQQLAKSIYSNVEFGQFGADMQVALVNDGPVTFTLRTKTN